MPSRSAPCWIIAVFACAWTALFGQPALETLGPGDEFEREIDAKIQASSGRDEALLNEAARRRAERDGVPLPLALATVHRKLGLIAVERSDWKYAEAHFGSAYTLATRFEDARFIIDVLCLRAYVRFRADARADAQADAEEAWSLAKRIGDGPRQVRAGFELARLRNVSGRPKEADAYFEEMLLLEGIDRLPIELRRAEIANGVSVEYAESRWRSLVAHARERGATDVLARGLDELARCALSATPSKKPSRYSARRTRWTPATRARRSLGSITARR